MANDIQNKNYHNRYDISNYTQLCPRYNEPNPYNYVYLQNFYMHKTSVLNVKAFTERCKFLNQWKDGTCTNINLLKKLCNEILAKPPIKTNGIATASKKVEELILLLDEYKKNLDKINTASMISTAKIKRENDITSAINKLESYIKMEEVDKEVNLHDSKLTIMDYANGDV